MALKTLRINIMKETTSLTLVNFIFKVYFDKEIGKVEKTDFEMLKGKRRKAFVRDMNKIQRLITEEYNSTLDFISYSLQVVK